MGRSGRGGTVVSGLLLFWALPTLFAPSPPLWGEVAIGAPEDAARVPVLVALEVVHGGRDASSNAEAAWLQRLVRQLEHPEGGSPPLRVPERFLLERESLDELGLEEDEERLRDVAREKSLRFVVVVSLTSLADRYSLQVRLLAPEGELAPSSQTVLEGKGVEGLAAIMDRAAAMARLWVAESPAPRPRPSPAPLARPQGGSPAKIPDLPRVGDGPSAEASETQDGPPSAEGVLEKATAPPQDSWAPEGSGATSETVPPPTLREGELPPEQPSPGQRVAPRDVLSEVPEDIGRSAAPSGQDGARPQGSAPGEPLSEPPAEEGGPSGAPEMAPSTDGPSASEAPGPRVVAIRVVGSRRIDEDAILGRVATRVGEPFHAGRAREDVRRVFELGFFRDVQVLASDDPQGVVVTFAVEENPVIREVSVSGNDSVGAEEIKEQLTLTVGSTIDYPLLLENRQRIKGLYQSKGFHLAEVEAKVEPLSEEAVSVEFEIEEGQKLHLTEIDFQGNDHLADRRLLKVMQTRTWKFYSRVTSFFDRSGVYAEPIFYQDLDRIRRLYMDEGYIQVRIAEPEVRHDEEGLRVTVRIEEGDRFSVGAVGIEGNGVFDHERLQELLTLQTGDVFSRSRLTEQVERLRGHYADRGFYFARVEPDMRVNEEARTVDCSFRVEKGDLYFVDRIHVRGNTRTRDPVVRREIELAEGELYSSTALDRSQARVRRLGFFEEVSLETRPLDVPNQVEVDVEVVERPTGTFSFGAGVGSTDGFLANASVRQDNLFGRGYQLTANVDLGSEVNDLLLRFTDPYVFGTAASFSTAAFQTERDYIDFDQEVMGLDFTVGYPLDEGDTRGFGGYSFTEREITGEDVIASSLVQREEFQNSTTTSLLSLSFRRDTRDDIRFPKRGQITGFGLEFAGLGGLSQFLRFEGRTTWFLPLQRWLGFSSTFIVNSRAGYVFPLNSIGDFDLPGCGLECQAFVALDPSQIQPLTNIDTDLELPISERYFLGGVGPFQVRGFKQRSLGPRRPILSPQSFVTNPGDKAFFPSGFTVGGGCLYGPGGCNDLGDTDIDDFEDLELADVIGGNKFFLLNLELRFPISEEFGLEGIVFLDMGNAFAENESINPADLRFGTGAGVQWFSPFGPILLQLGIPLDPLEDEDSSVFEFSLGGSAY
jgi:outer membrane protein insertion porin family